MDFTEREIEQRLKCPMIGGSPPAPYFICAQTLLRWAALEAFRGRLVPVPTLRGKFEDLWKRSADWIAYDQAFYKGIRLGNSAAKRVYLFLQQYEVLKPVENYCSQSENGNVTGEFGLFLRHHDRRTEEKPMILQSHEHRPVHFERPEPIELLRYLHVMLTTEYADVGVYHLPLFRGLPWKRKNFDLPLVQRAVVSILGTVRNSVHPTPGSHCKDCVGRKCGSIANG